MAMRDATARRGAAGRAGGGRSNLNYKILKGFLLYILRRPAHY
jgi:hypothetical protein